jgi:hypothetical protein
MSDIDKFALKLKASWTRGFNDGKLHRHCPPTALPNEQELVAAYEAGYHHGDIANLAELKTKTGGRN